MKIADQIDNERLQLKEEVKILKNILNLKNNLELK